MCLYRERDRVETNHMPDILGAGVVAGVKEREEEDETERCSRHMGTRVKPT
jgi:hypothetical protein